MTSRRPPPETGERLEMSLWDPTASCQDPFVSWLEARLAPFRPARSARRRWAAAAVVAGAAVLVLWRLQDARIGVGAPPQSPATAQQTPSPPSPLDAADLDCESEAPVAGAR